MICHCDPETKEFVILKGENFPKIIIKLLNKSDKIYTKNILPKRNPFFLSKKISKQSNFQTKITKMFKVL